MKIENLKPGDKVKLFKFETLVKKGLIDKETLREIPYRYIGIVPEMIDIWNDVLTIEKIITNIWFDNNPYIWLPE